MTRNEKSAWEAIVIRCDDKKQVRQSLYFIAYNFEQALEYLRGDRLDENSRIVSLNELFPICGQMEEPKTNENHS